MNVGAMHQFSHKLTDKWKRLQQSQEAFLLLQRDISKATMIP